MYGGNLAISQNPKTVINSEEPWIHNPVPDSKKYTDEPEPSEKSVNLFGPLFLWSFVIIVGLIMEVVLPSLLGKNFVSLAASSKNFGNYILMLPGAIILPLVISVWIGHRVGERSKSVLSAMRSGLINGVYASIVYGVVILVVQLILKSVVPALAPSTSFEIKYLAAIPIAIVVIFTIVIAVLNEMRH